MSDEARSVAIGLHSVDRLAAPLARVIPVYRLDRGPLLKKAKPWWIDLLGAQRYELDRTLGTATEVTDFAELDRLVTPSVLLVPVAAGGTVAKSQWPEFQDALWRYVRRGGVVAVLLQGFCLQEEGERAGGRRFAGITTRARKNWIPGVVEFGVGVRPLATCPRIAAGDELPAPFIAAAIDTEHGFWTEHEVVDASKAGEACTSVAYVARGAELQSLALRLAYSPHEWPGCVLFLNTWSWMRSDLIANHKRVRELNSGSIGNTFRCLRSINREIVLSGVAFAQERVSGRLARMELLSGANDRLRRVLGSEKDYHRLLANDPELCLDLLCVRRNPVAESLRRAVAGGRLMAEPPHPIGGTRRGRLDLLLFAPGQAVDAETRSSLDSYLAGASRTPVAWVELEAGVIDASQMHRFVSQSARLFRRGDFICAVDRSPDDSSEVKAVARQVETTGAEFVHVRVPEAFDALEDTYLPTLNRLSRKRFTLEVIRALLG